MSEVVSKSTIREQLLRHVSLISLSFIFKQLPWIKTLQIPRKFPLNRLKGRLQLLQLLHGITIVHGQPIVQIKAVLGCVLHQFQQCFIPPLVLMELDSNPNLSKILPIVWVMNWDSAAYLSWSAQLISTILHPSLAKTSKNLPHLEILISSFPILTLSYMKGRPAHPFLPLSGPNIGCVQRISNSSGKISRNRLLGNSFTDKTSTNSVLRRSLWNGIDSSTDFVERIEVHSITTSGCSSQRSCGSLKKETPSFAAVSELSEREWARTVWPWLTKVFARN